MRRDTSLLSIITLLCALTIARGSPVPEDRIVPETALLASTAPDWFAAEVSAIRADGADQVFSTSALWHVIQKWDSKHPESPFFTQDDTQNKIQLAAFLGNVAQETGDLRIATEHNHADDTKCSIASKNCFKRYGNYFGRGALQITCWGGEYCKNYKDLEDAFGAHDIEDDPDQVSTNPELAWGSAVLFWCTNKGFGSLGPAAKYIPEGSFGGTYATINGNQECEPPTGPNKYGITDRRPANRIAKFKKACEAANVDCSKFELKCPVVRMGSCTIRDTWDCQKDQDCGSAGGTCDFSKVGGSTADSGDTATYDPECQPDSTPLVCSSEGQVARCVDHPDWSCTKHDDCGDCYKGARCTCTAADQATSPTPPGSSWAEGSSGSSCCTWDPFTQCGNPVSAGDWCDQAQANCEGSCEGEWKPLRNSSPAPPRTGGGKCCWGITCVGVDQDEWCGASQSNCEGDCDGKWE